MGSDNEYEHINFWEKFNIKLNQDQESVVIESDKNIESLTGVQFIVFDVDKLFCKKIKKK
jgi:hypothetical protein